MTPADRDCFPLSLDPLGKPVLNKRAEKNFFRKRGSKENEYDPQCGGSQARFAANEDGQESRPKSERNE